MSALPTDTLRVVWVGDTCWVAGVARDAHLTLVNPDSSYHHVYLLSGQSADGSLTYQGTARATFVLDNLDLTSATGVGPLTLKNKKTNEIYLPSGSCSRLSILHRKPKGKKQASKVLPDSLAKACIYCKGHLAISGEGALRLSAANDGGRGIHVKRDLHLAGGDVTIVTSGSYLYRTAIKRPAGPPPGMGEGPKGTFHVGQDGVTSTMTPAPFQTGAKEKTGGTSQEPGSSRGGSSAQSEGRSGVGGPMGEEIRGSQWGAALSMGPADGRQTGDHPEDFRPDRPMPDGNMPQGRSMPPGGGKFDYSGAAKGIKANGHITVSGGCLHITTQAPGAEGMEGKQGIRITGGDLRILAVDDALNANAPIVVEGGLIHVRSVGNDAIDVNYTRGVPYVQTGGDVVAISSVGPPEEGLDTDQQAVTLRGGTLFTAGASMGPIESQPTTSETTLSVETLRDFTLVEGDTVRVADADGVVRISFVSPCAFHSTMTVIAY